MCLWKSPTRRPGADQLDGDGADRPRKASVAKCLRSSPFRGCLSCTPRAALTDALLNLWRSRVRESRRFGSVGAKAEWLSHPTITSVGRMCSWPLLQAPDTVCGVHSAVELTGSGRVLGHFSDTSPCLCSFCVRPAPERRPSACRHRQGVNGHSKFPHLRSSKTPPPLVEDSDETNAGGRCGQAVCGLSKSLWARVRVHSDGGVHGPLIAQVPAIVGLTTPDFSLSFNRYESPRMLMVVA